MDDPLAKYGGAIEQAAPPPGNEDPLAKYGGSLQSPEEMANDPNYDPFIEAEKLHHQILGAGGTDEDFGKHPVFPDLLKSQAARVKNQAESRDYNPAQAYQDAQDRAFTVKGTDPTQPDYAEKLAAHKAQIAAQTEEARRVFQYRARNYGNVNSHGPGIDWKQAYHGIKEGGKELYGVLPTVQGVGYIGQDVGQGARGIVSNDPAVLAKAELARRELQRGTLKVGLGGVNIGRGLAHWWENASYLPGGTRDKEKTDAELNADLENEAKYKFDWPGKITAENYRPGNLNTAGSAADPTHAELVKEAGGAPTNWASGLRFGEAKDIEGKPVQVNPEEDRAAAIDTAIQFGLFGGATAPGTRLGALGGQVAGYTLKAAAVPLKLAQKIAQKAVGTVIPSRLMRAAERLAEETNFAERMGKEAAKGALRKPTILDEMIAGKPLVERGRFGTAVAEGTKGALSAAGGATPFILGADTPEQGIQTALGLALMGGIHQGTGEAITGNAWKTGAVRSLSKIGASLQTNPVYDPLHQKATQGLPQRTTDALNAVRGIMSRFKDAQGNPLEMHALTPEDYRAELARQNPKLTPAELDAAARTQGYTSPDGKAFINTGAGDPTQPGYHEGGHLVKAALEAMDGAIKESAKSAIAETLYDKHGAILPVFNKFIDGYNAAVPASHVIDITKPEDLVRAEDEFIAEHMRNIGNKGDAKGLGAIVTGDTITGRIGAKFKEWAKSVGIKAPDKLKDFGWQEVPEFTRRFNKILRDAFKDAHNLPAAEPSAPAKDRQNKARMDQIASLPRKDRTPAILAEYDKLRLENETLAKQGQQIPQPPQPGTPNASNAAPTSPAAAPQAPVGVSEAEMRENVRKALIQLGVNQRTAKQLAAAAKGASDAELLRDALARRGAPKGALSKPPVPAPVPVKLKSVPSTIGSEPQAGPNTKQGALSEPEAPEVPLGTRHGDLVMTDRGWQYDTAPENNIVANDVRKTESAPTPEPAPTATPDTAAEDAAIEQQVATSVKAPEERLPYLQQLATARAGTDPRLIQTRTDKRGKVTFSGRLDFSLPEHRALVRELNLTPEQEANLRGAQEAEGAKYVDYWSASKEAGAESDISGKQRAKEYAADKDKASRDTLQKNKAIVFTSAAVTSGGKVVQRGLSVDKFLGNVAKLLDAAHEHKLGVDYHGINDPQIQQDLDGYIANHKNVYKGDGSGPVAGETPTEGYEPYQIPRNRFDLLNAAFHNEASTGQSRYQEKVSAHEAAKAKGEKTRKPALRAETAENAADAQALAQENQWQIDDATGDTNPFRAMLNREGKLTHPGKGGALRQGTGEVLEPVWESLAPDMISAIRDQPVGDRAIVRDVGYTGEPKGVFSKGLPNSKFVAGGFMPETPPNPEVQKAAESKGYHTGPLWHGTKDGKLRHFDSDSHGGSRTDSGLMGTGTYFTNKRSVAEHYGGSGFGNISKELKEGPFETNSRGGGIGQFYVGGKILDAGYVNGAPSEKFHNVAKALGVEIPPEIRKDVYVGSRGSKASADWLREQATKQGYDGVTVQLSQGEDPYTETVIFNPKQIKSSDEITHNEIGDEIPLANRFNNKTDDIRFMPETNHKGALSNNIVSNEEPQKPTFYSALERTAADKVKGRATPEQIAATLRNNGVKQEELDWVLGDYLKGKAGQKITPEELQAAIVANRVELTEVKKGEPDKNALRASIERAIDMSDPESLDAEQFPNWRDDAELLQAKGRDALEALDRGDINEVKSILHDNSVIEMEYGDNPAWRGPLKHLGEDPKNQSKFSQYQLPGGPLSRDTELLTENGWKRIDTIRIGERVMTRRDEDGKLEWQPVEGKPYVYANKLYHFKSQSVDMMVTAEHNMLVKRARRSKQGLFRITAEKLWKTCECVIPLTGHWDAKQPNLFGLDAGDVAEFLGWYLAEGDCAISDKGTKSTIFIAQDKKANPGKCVRIEALLDRLGFKWKNYAEGSYAVGCNSVPFELRTWIYAQGKSRDKFIPPFMLQQSKRVIWRMLESMIMGDGHTHLAKSLKKRHVIFTLSERMAGGIQAAALMVGKRASVRQRPVTKLYEIALLEKQWSRVDDARHAIVDYNDFAYCVTVQNHAIYVRRNGVAAFTGNSNYREFLFTLPETKLPPGIEIVPRKNQWGEVWDVLQNGKPVIEGVAGKQYALDWIKQWAERNGQNQTFKSSHYDEPNIVFHTRTNDRTTTDGRSMLFAEELQSDWHQKGRDAGYNQPPFKAEDLKLIDDHKASAGQHIYTYELPDGERVGSFAIEQGRPESEARQQAFDRVSKKELALPNKPGVPDAPFKSNAWKALGLKKLLAKAVEEGKDAIGWTPGEVQTGRWGTERIEWAKQDDGSYLVNAKAQHGGNAAGVDLEGEANARNLNPQNSRKITTKEELEQAIKPSLTEGQKSDKLAEKIWTRMQSEPSGVSQPRKEAMEEFYDKQLVNIANDIGKKYGARVQKAEIETGESRGDDIDIKDSEAGFTLSSDGQYLSGPFDTYGDAKDARDAIYKKDTTRNPPAQVWQLPITPELKSAVIRGQALFMPEGKSTSYQTKPAKTGALSGALPAPDEKKHLPQKRGALQMAN